MKKIQYILHWFVSYFLKSNLNWIELNWIQVVCNLIQYFHSNENQFAQTEFTFSIHRLSLVVCSNVEPNLG